MSVLLLGGRGKTTSQIADMLHKLQHPFVVASRTTSPSSQYFQAYFDWFDENTFEGLFSTASQQGMGNFSAIWLVAPPVADMATPMNKFIDFAMRKAVKRFVLCSGSPIEKGGQAMGQVHAYLDSISDIERVTLRPTWFMDNFSFPGEWQLLSIKNESKIYSATGKGKIAFISAKDIAKVAVKVLTNKVLKSTEHILLGPELIDYDQVASTISQVIGRKITHVDLSEADLVKKMLDYGTPPFLAEGHAAMEIEINKLGRENVEWSQDVKDVSGFPPETFQAFALENKQAWT